MFGVLWAGEILYRLYLIRVQFDSFLGHYVTKEVNFLRRKLHLDVCIFKLAFSSSWNTDFKFAMCSASERKKITPWNVAGVFFRKMQSYM